MSKWKKNREATTKTVCDPETIKYFMFGTLQKTFANPWPKTKKEKGKKTHLKKDHYSFVFYFFPVSSVCVTMENLIRI